MKFDYVIGNPPYQVESENTSTTNGQAPRKNVFQYFQMQADKIADKGSIMVYPGARWMHQSGKGMKQFGLDQINDKHVSLLEYYPDSSELFNGTTIPDGVSIVCKNMDKSDDSFKYNYIKKGIKDSVIVKCPGENLIPLDPKDFSVAKKLEEFVEKYKLDYLNEHILPRSLFNIESDFVHNNPDAVRIYNEGDTFDTKNEIKLFTNGKAGASGRSMWFICSKDEITSNKEYIGEWQVVVSSAHPGGQDGRDSQMSIIDDHSAFGRARVALASFKTKTEAENFYNYCKSDIIRYAFLMTDEALTSLAKKVPLLKSYKTKNGFLDFNKNIDEQLSNLIGFSESEMEYIKEIVANNGPKGKETD